MEQEQLTLDIKNDEKQAARVETRRRYIISCIVAAVLVVLICWIKGIFDGGEFSSARVKACWLFTNLFDVFGIVGFVYLCVGALVFCSNHGTYDIFTFGFRQTLGRFFINEEERKKYKDLGEYRKAKAGKRVEYIHFVWIGLGMIVLSAIFYFVAQGLA